MSINLSSFLLGHVAYFVCQSLWRWSIPWANQLGESFVRVATAMHLWQWSKWLTQIGFSLANWASAGAPYETSPDRIYPDISG